MRKRIIIFLECIMCTLLLLSACYGEKEEKTGDGESIASAVTAHSSEECWPSTNTIARALGMSQSTVISKIDSLVRRQLIGKRGTLKMKVPTQADPCDLSKPPADRAAHELSGQIRCLRL